MKKLLILASLALLFTLVSAQASPLCTAAADNKFSTLKAFGACTIGDFEIRFNDIAPSGQPGNTGSSTAVTAAQVEARTTVNLTPGGPTSLGVTFNVLPVGLELNGLNNLGIKQGAGLFGSASYTFNYTVTPITPTYGIYGLVYDVTGIYAPVGSVTGYKQLKDNDGNVLAQRSIDVVQTTAGPVSSSSGAFTFATSLGRTFVQDTLNFVQGSDGGAYIGQGTLTNTLSFENVPEPMSMVLAGAGLLGLGVLRRRTRKA